MDIKRVLGISLLVGAALVFSALGSLYYYSEMEPEDSPYWWTGASLTGQVLKVEPRSLTLNTPGGPVVFKLDEHTRVVLRGGSTLVPGVIAQIKFKDVKTAKIARGVRILKSPAGAATPTETAAPEETSGGGASPSAEPSGAPASPSGAPASPGTETSPGAASPGGAGTPSPTGAASPEGSGSPAGAASPGAASPAASGTAAPQ